MKYIKLFEQFDWENNPFGEDLKSSNELEVGDKVILINRENALYRSDREFFLDSTNDIGWRVVILKKKKLDNLETIINVNKGGWYNIKNFKKV